MKGPRRRIELVGKGGGVLQTERDKKRLSIGVAVPQRGQSPSKFTNALVAMMTYSSLALQDVADIVYAAVEGTYIHTNRNDLTGTLLRDADVDFILWLDDDMTFPRDTLVRLLQHRVAFVGANYSTRTMPLTPVSIKRIGDGFGRKPERLQTREEDTGLERVEAIGFGVCLTRADVLWDVGYPWFETRKDEKLGVNVGEDVDFCIKARAAGHDVFVDHGLSQEVRHIGQMEYSVAHAVAFEEEQTHGDNDIRLVTDGDQQLAESVGHDDAGNYPRLHSISGSEAESDGGDS
ncbi:hypothetical protein LCGC14_1869950 [marine sediment metagenome]|uniref:Glycosyltransferase 2-like domain-containing protein n=1 Tax=marine sediment metagenome TaxID=412755 RepID=A0A0F9G5D4_9ZZZZ